MDVGKRVREVRKDLGMPQAELARRVGVARNYIVMIEMGGREPSLGVLERIAHGLRTEPAELLRDPTPKVSAPPSEATTGQAVPEIELEDLHAHGIPAGHEDLHALNRCLAGVAEDTRRSIVEYLRREGT